MKFVTQLLAPVVLASLLFLGAFSFADAQSVERATSRFRALRMAASSSAPVIGACGTSPSIPAHNGTAAFAITLGTGMAGTCAVTLPAAATGWNCVATNITGVIGTTTVTKVTAASTTSVTFSNFTDAGVVGNFVDSQTLRVSCFAY
jgi:hypothetical protein